MGIFIRNSGDYSYLEALNSDRGLLIEYCHGYTRPMKRFINEPRIHFLAMGVMEQEAARNSSVCALVKKGEVLVLVSIGLFNPVYKKCLIWLQGNTVARDPDEEISLSEYTHYLTSSVIYRG